MNITRFFTDILEAKLRTPYRWGAIIVDSTINNTYYGEFYSEF